ncbi:sugar phosphate isomerase/epimerase [Dysgonomonas hofstadii]|uniref:Sugar phosphate isomerase/epimerase n=1 Tax=Dysgonomonas hofstadii TaxID=637886 RepID=A0A840CJ19_9BACT|nr:sugar phosphate isomerase/epimerase [Dysgonomonas hofstadii]MBB4035336.1 sugar phosphate isomerase/epimerase [Dysgonomonas hofstadii]
MKNKFYLLALLASLIILPHTLQAQKKGEIKKDIAIQLYSVRDRIGSYVGQTGGYQNDYTAILKELAQMGYTSVEAAGYNDGKFYGRTPQEFKKDVEAAGLKVLSSHCTKSLTHEELVSGDFTESLKWWDTAIKAHKEAGMTYIVTPWLDVPATVKDLKTYCDYYNEIGKRCKANGLKYGYHNHAHEFQKVEDEVVMMDYMIENTNPEYVFIEMDVYWVVIGKNSPVDYFKKYPGRFSVLHIKDHREIGQSGMVGFDAIFKNAEIAGVKHIVVEVEKYSTTIEESIKTSLDYLLDAQFVKASYSK